MNELEEKISLIKVGDLCIFWNELKSEATVSRLMRIGKKTECYKSNNFEWYCNAIKFESPEQYINFIKS